MIDYDGFYEDLRKLLPETGKDLVIAPKSIQKIEKILSFHFYKEKLELKISGYSCESVDKDLRNFCIEVRTKDNSVVFLSPKDFRRGAITLLNNLSTNLKLSRPNHDLILKFWSQVLEPLGNAPLTDREINFLDKWFSSIDARKLSTKEYLTTLCVSINHLNTKNHTRRVLNDYYIPHCMGKKEIFAYIFSTNRLPFFRDANKYNFAKER